MAEAPPFKTWNDVATTTHVRPPFLIEEFIPSDGDVLLWGVSSVGKTPIMWHMARAIATGQDFAGYHTIQGPVLLIELDQAEMVTTERIKHLPLLPDNAPLIVEHMDPFDTPLSDKVVERLTFLRDVIQPRAVFIDTLRKCHSLDDNLSASVQTVYGQFRKLFPGTGRIYIAHQRKTGVDDHRPPEESFTGARAWINDATIAFQAEGVKGGSGGGVKLKLTCRKNQLGEVDWHTDFRLVNGVELTTDAAADDILRAIVATEPKRRRVQVAVEQLGIPVRTARRKIREIEELMGETDD